MTASSNRRKSYRQSSQAKYCQSKHAGGLPRHENGGEHNGPNRDTDLGEFVTCMYRTGDKPRKREVD